MFNLLDAVSKEVYKKNEYTSFSKDDKGVYYATLSDLTRLKYDVSLLSNCEQDQAVIFFDIDHIMATSYENEPIQISVTCVSEK